jgi:hypothetical protein
MEIILVFHIVPYVDPMKCACWLSMLGQIRVKDGTYEQRPTTCARFGTSLLDPLLNSVWEALAILIALHPWGPQAPACSRLEIKSDSLAALRAIEKGYPHPVMARHSPPAHVAFWVLVPRFPPPLWRDLAVPLPLRL